MAIVGIDLGTTYSVVAKLNELGKPEILPNQDTSNPLTPSVVFFESEQVVIIGETAKNSAGKDAERVVQFAKNYMGQAKTWHFFGRDYIPEQISALILKKLKQDAEAYLDEPITQAVITVPAIFGYAERTATKKAAEIAGIEVLAIVNEPVAAALSYGFGKKGAIRESQNVLVYDLGGGTFDITVMQISEDRIKVLHTDGDRLLGGKLWDDAIIRYVAECFQAAHGSDPLQSSQMLQDLRERAEQAKRHLSQRDKSSISCSYAGQSLPVEITREKFEELTADLLKRTRATTEWVMQQLVEAGKLTGWQDIHQILLVGGSSKMPQVMKMMKELSGQEPKLYDPDLAVAKGAALYAMMQPELGEEILSDPTGTTGIIPVDNISSHAIGIESIDRADNRVVINRVIIPKNTELPKTVTQDFKTSVDDRTVVEISILQGDDPDPAMCKRLADFHITGIPRGLQKGSPIKVTLTMTHEELIQGKAVETTHNTECIFEIKPEREVDIPEAKKNLPEVE